MIGLVSFVASVSAPFLALQKQSGKALQPDAIDQPTIETHQA